MGCRGTELEIFSHCTDGKTEAQGELITFSRFHCMSDGKVCSNPGFLLCGPSGKCEAGWEAVQGELMYERWEFKWSQVRAER